MRVDYIVTAKDMGGPGIESWLCVDCGMNTAPGCLNASETRCQVDTLGYSLQYVDNTSEVYAVRDKVWAEARMSDFGGCLCIGCLERRLRRKLRPKDFPRHPFNAMPGTSRLRKRRGKDNA
jgi:hypothetical protein